MDMNDRVMQFRIGMFVIVAGLVLTMMIVWFGESPALLRDQVYLKVHYAEAPGVLEGVPVRKSGIRIGEVIAIAFDERSGAPDGVLVTLALERRYKLREGTRPRLDRSLIGDVSVDMQPGTGSDLLPTGNTPLDAPVVEGTVAPDPSKALAAATKAFESAGDTLRTINEAASGLAKLTKSADRVEEFVTTWSTTGKELTSAGRAVSKIADTADKLITDNQKDFHAAIAYITTIAHKVDDTLDEKLQAELKQAVERFSGAADRLNSGIAQLEPALKELGGPSTQKPVTDLGQAVRRLNLIAADVALLTTKLRDGKGGLNTEGSLQRLLTQADLYDNLNKDAVQANQALQQLKTVLKEVRTFAEKVARDPAAIGRGVLQR
jgi:phospholipid/cholesterol/gamma-HCH transport system substrate-binding protein